MRVDATDAARGGRELSPRVPNLYSARENVSHGSEFFSLCISGSRPRLEKQKLRAALPSIGRPLGEPAKLREQPLHSLTIGIRIHGRSSAASLIANRAQFELDQ